jgi:hypothetical protein
MNSKNTRAYWAKRIKTTYTKTVADIIAVGQLFIDAKAALPHGEFEKLIELDCVISPRTAQRYMAIARDLRINKSDRLSLLPANWSVLYELTRLSDEQFAKAISDGTINADMTGDDLSRLLNDEAPKEELPLNEEPPSKTWDIPPVFVRPFFTDIREPEEPKKLKLQGEVDRLRTLVANMAGRVLNPQAGARQVADFIFKHMPEKAEEIATALFALVSKAKEAPPAEDDSHISRH